MFKHEDFLVVPNAANYSSIYLKSRSVSLELSIQT